VSEQATGAAARPLPPSHKGQKFPPEVLTPEEVKALIRAGNPRAPTGLRNRAIIAMLYGAGLRLSEALALRPNDVNIDAGTVLVRHGKGDKDRTASIDEVAAGHVARWMDARRVAKIGGRLLFVTLAGQPLQPRYVRAMLERYAARAGLERRANPHALRHSHAAQLERRGVPVTLIQEQLGHSSLQTTSTYLRHISPTERVERIRKAGLGL
jgi:integrase/recombinase XerD